MKKTIMTLLLISMLAVPVISVLVAGDGTSQLSQVAYASSAGRGSYPSYIYAPPWVIDRYDEWYHGRWRDYYNTPFNGYSSWGWGYGPDTVTPRVVATPKPAQPQYGRASYGGIVYSTEYLYQININNRSIDGRLFGDGEKTVFKLSMAMREDGGIRLIMTDTRTHDEIKPVFTKKAVNYLEDVGIDEVVVVSRRGDQQTYSLDALRDAAMN